MQLRKVLEQHIAVFGESGSGKTVLVSSFYGAMQEAEFLNSSLFDVTADDAALSQRLHRNYLGMRDSARPPQPHTTHATPYSFTVRLQNQDPQAGKANAFDAARLVWHDYPGEWFEEEVSSTTESELRVATFRSLLRADVALLLIDGQRLLDQGGEEERYLKALFTSYRTGLVRLRDDLLDEGKPLVKFPRIWIVALSKADLLPDLDVFGFRDLVIDKAADDLDALRKVIASLVDSPEALSVGEDFVRLSSARFEPNAIEVSERIGVDLMLPMAAMLPFERHVIWMQRKQIAADVAEKLLVGGGLIAAALLKKTNLDNALGRLLRFVGRKDVGTALIAAATLAGEKLREANEAARRQHDDLAVVLTGFKLQLEDAEDQRILIRSRR